jgi:hypothetical protein
VHSLPGKPEATSEETWLRLDSLRVRMEMLPGGLVIERDTNITKLQSLMALMQSCDFESSEQVHYRHAEIRSQIVWLTDLVEQVEMSYWQWCVDAAALPVDMPAKQQVHDWLMPEGEKEAVLDQMYEVGARRCPGPSSISEETASNGDRTCKKFLQYGLYKSKVRRCPACIKKSKQMTALSATQNVRQSLLAAMRPRASSCGARRRSVLISEVVPAFIPVESRQMAFALYAGSSPNTYYPAYVLPSDLELAKANDVHVTVHWADGDRRHRSVQTEDVVLMDQPEASEVRFCEAAQWSDELQRLIPKTPPCAT